MHEGDQNESDGSKPSDQGACQQAALLRGMFDNMSSGAAIYEVRGEGSRGCDYIIREFNAASLRLEGKTRDEVVGRSLADLRPNIDQYGLIPVFQKVWRTGEPAFFPARFYLDEQYSNWYENRIFRLPTGEIVAMYDDVTERKTLEEKLRKREEFYRAVVEDQSELICRFNRDGVLAWVNEACARLAGLPPDELIGRNFLVFLSDEARFKTVESLALLTPACPVSENFQRMFRPDARECWIHWRNRGIFNRDGSLREIQGVGRDITELKLAEISLQESRSQMLAILEGIPDGIIAADVETRRFNYANRQICRMLGYDVDALQGMTVADLHPVQDLTQVLPLFERALQGLESDVQDISVKRSDGSVFYADIHCSSLVLAGRSCLLGIFRDVTQRHQAAAALRTSEANFRKITEHMNEVVWLRSGDYSRMLYINPAYENIWGRSCASLYADPRSFLDALHPDDRDATIRAFDNAAATGNFDGEYRVIRPDGTVRWVHARGYPVLDEAGTLINHAGVAADITDRKLAEEQLRLAKDSAETANRAKSAFLANMSHELRTPLNAVMGFADLLLESEPTAEQSKYLEIVRDRGNDLLVLVNDMLDLARIEADRMQLTLEPLSLSGLVADVARMMSLPAERKGLKLEVELAPGLPELLYGDARRLRQVLVNLVGNAVKFTEQGKIAVTVASEPAVDGSAVAGPGAVLRFSVHDTGPGIPADKMDEIFEAFSQVDTSTTRRYGGAGLGLTIVKRMVELMGGRVWVESSQGRGSVFHFTAHFGPLPAMSKPPAVQAAAAPARGRPLSILFADDDAMSGILVEHVLGRIGHKVIHVGSGTAAFKLLQKQSFDLILLDLRMPDMDGLTTARKIRAMPPDAAPRAGNTSDDPPAVSGIPIVAITAEAMPGDREKCLAAGMNAYLTKPFCPSQLVDLISRLGR